MYVNHYFDTVFNERHAFRFADQWIWDLDELDAYFGLLNLMKLTANPATRVDGLKRVSLQSTLEKGFSEEGRQRITSFYTGV
jgi:hypothetical protein